MSGIRERLCDFRPQWVVPLVVILALGGWMRLAGLGDVQQFEVDQGRDYLVVMDWLQDGKWPLLGPSRSYGGFDLGPGWFYLLAPLMGLSGFDPGSGAATVVFLSLCMQILAWFWVRRLTGSRLAALAAVAAFAFGADWVAMDRTLWNPNALPCATLAFACLLELLGERPLVSGCGLILLCLLVPQLHTSGVVLAAAGLGCAIPILWRERRRLVAAPRARWIMGLAVVIVGFVFLYLPPIVYEFTSSKSNFAAFVREGYSTGGGAVGSWAGGLFRSVEAMWQLLRSRTLGSFDHAPAGAFVLLVVFLFSMGVVGQMAFRRRGSLSLRFLLLVPFGFWLGGALLNRSPLPYQYSALAPLPVLFVAVAGGRGLNSALGTRARKVERWLGGVWVALLILLAAGNLPGAWGVHEGHVWYGNEFAKTRAIADTVLQKVKGRRYSFILIEPGNNASHFDYLFRRGGHRPVNRNLDTAGVKDLEAFGDVLVLVVRGGAVQWPVSSTDRRISLVPDRIEDATVYWIQRSQVAGRMSSLAIDCSGGKIVLELRER